jgi:hypothetical protein
MLYVYTPEVLALPIGPGALGYQLKKQQTQEAQSPGLA